MKVFQTFWVSAVLLFTALLLFLDPWPFVSPLPAVTEVPSWVTDPTPVRQPSLIPQYVVAGYSYRCSDCHKVIASPAETDRTLTQHREIELNHGMNTRCFNCHHRTQRDAFVDDLGQPISWDEPQRLCAKCHGPVYRDWQHGSHGRSNGYWDQSRGAQTRRKCIECHDPHAPPFPPMAPAPGPNTLRMTWRPHSGGEAPRHQDHDPLRIRTEAASHNSTE